MIVKESVHVVFDEFNNLSFKDAPRNVGIEESMETLEITQENQEIQEEAGEKNIQLEVVPPRLENQKQDGENSNLPKEWRFVHNHLTNLIICDPSRGVTTINSIRAWYERLSKFLNKNNFVREKLITPYS